MSSRVSGSIKEILAAGGTEAGPCRTTPTPTPHLNVKYDRYVEGLYCKRPIQCLASSEILTLHRPAPPPPAFGAGGGHTRWVERGWGVNSSEDAKHCSVLYICGAE